MKSVEMVGGVPWRTNEEEAVKRVEVEAFETAGVVPVASEELTSERGGCAKKL